MKRIVIQMIAVVALSALQTKGETTVYFSDSFDRANRANLNASSSGKSGILGALDWSVNNIPGTATVDINGYALRINESTSSGGAIVWPDHNFTEPTGEFWVSTVIGYTSSGGNGRTAGFGIGQTLADLTGATFGYPTSAGSPPADVYVSYDNIGTDKNIYIVTNRSVAATIPLVASLPDTLSAHFTFDDMNAGSALNYEVFLDGVSIYSGSTVWSGTDENYISLMANTTLDSKFSRFVVSDDIVLFSDDMERFTATGVAPSAGAYAEYRYNSMATVRDEGTATPFGTDNQYIEVKDDDINVGVSFMSQEFPETRAALSTYSFDFYEPSTGGGSGILVGYSRLYHNLATAYARISLRLTDGTVGQLSTGSGTYDLDTAYRLTMIFNDTDNTVDYEYGSIAPQVADIWLQKLDGTNPKLIGTRSAANSRAHYSVGFITFKSDLQDIYVDNIDFSMGAILTFPPPRGTVLKIM